MPEYPRPMRMTDVSYDSAHQYINDDEWVLEQKLDGARAYVVATRLPNSDEFVFEWNSSGGGPIKFAAATQHIEHLNVELARMLSLGTVQHAELDGELIIESGVFHLFDMPKLTAQHRTVVSPDSPYELRKLQLESRFFSGEAVYDSIQIVPTAWATAEKVRLWEWINETNVEGGMAKRKDAKYEYGTRSKSMVKLKLVKSADVVVTRVSRTFKDDGVTLSHGNCDLVVMISPEEDPSPFVDERGRRWSEDALNQAKRKPKKIEFKPRTQLQVGSASLIGKDLSIEVGSVVEVNYLYFQDAMIQPRIVRKRREEEKRAEDCRMDQFPEYSRKAARYEDVLHR